MTMLWLVACDVGWVPFQNEPPRLLTINGEPYEPEVTLRTRLAPYVPGERYPLALEIEDPEGDPYQIWFPESPGRVIFSPDSTTGDLWVPEGAIGTLTLWVVLEDLQDPEIQRTYAVHLASEAMLGAGQDTD